MNFVRIQKGREFWRADTIPRHAIPKSRFDFQPCIFRSSDAISCHAYPEELIRYPAKNIQKSWSEYQSCIEKLIHAYTIPKSLSDCQSFISKGWSNYLIMHISKSWSVDMIFRGLIRFPVLFTEELIGNPVNPISSQVFRIADPISGHVSTPEVIPMSAYMYVYRELILFPSICILGTYSECRIPKTVPIFAYVPGMHTEFRTPRTVPTFSYVHTGPAVRSLFHSP